MPLSYYHEGIGRLRELHLDAPARLLVTINDEEYSYPLQSPTVVPDWLPGSHPLVRFELQYGGSTGLAPSWYVATLEVLDQTMPWFEYIRDVRANAPTQSPFVTLQGVVMEAGPRWLVLDRVDGPPESIRIMTLGTLPSGGHTVRARCLRNLAMMSAREYRLVSWEMVESPNFSPIGVSVDTLTILEDLQDDLRELVATGKFNHKVGRGLLSIRERIESVVLQETILKKQRESRPVGGRRPRRSRLPTQSEPELVLPPPESLPTAELVGHAPTIANLDGWSDVHITLPYMRDNTVMTGPSYMADVSGNGDVNE